MTGTVTLMPIPGPAANAPVVGTVLVRAMDGHLRWQVTLRGFTWGLRRTMPRYGQARGVGIGDGMAAAHEIAEAHGLGITWHDTRERNALGLRPELLMATGVFHRG